jgi:hypothetical protein
LNPKKKKTEYVAEKHWIWHRKVKKKCGAEQRDIWVQKPQNFTMRRTGGAALGLLTVMLCGLCLFQRHLCMGALIFQNQSNCSHHAITR